MTEQETATLGKIADVATDTERSRQAVAVSDQILHRASAALSDVYAHGLSQTSALRVQLENLEREIELRRDAAIQHIQLFVQLVGESEDVAAGISRSISRIGEHLAKAG